MAAEPSPTYPVAPEGTDPEPHETPEPSPGLTRVTDGVWRVATANSNVYLIAAGDAGEWVLIDAGIPGFAGRLDAAADHLFDGRPPEAVVLTHGHFDHIGNLRHVLDRYPQPPRPRPPG